MLLFRLLTVLIYDNLSKSDKKNSQSSDGMEIVAIRGLFEFRNFKNKYYDFNKFTESYQRSDYR